ncbi:ATP synthase-coupling factor 6, mitochondrial [Liparis tanakae]|uniref:ATP synthase-coupling factor 6, mitochondrial n=1 Tax=Liparis tanakae TaxID=230148 RepID=A0A4Z2G4E0_9TELE|nr:ATP synthase-coupling factor 6, mitochondrial [Liparis tanakae]
MTDHGNLFNLSTDLNTFLPCTYGYSVYTSQVLLSPMDPIQKLFLDSIRDYSTRSQAAGGLVDAGSEYEKALAEEVAKLQRLYGGGDLASFPEFQFKEPKLDEVAQK